MPAAAPTQLGVLSTPSNATVISFVDFKFERVMTPLIPGGAGVLLMQRGLVAHGMHGIAGYSLTVLDRTHFINNTGVLLGGAVTVVAGHAHISQCVFDANRAPTMEEITNGSGPVAMIRSGFGGAVLGYDMGRMPGSARTSIHMVGCTFNNNSAYEGGAIAVLGVDTRIRNCTFAGNRAVKGGSDVYSSLGGVMNITDSNITAESDTVNWERVNASQCFVGEFFSAVRGICLKCLPSTYSLLATADTCAPCPDNAQVGCA
jgi:predicted outer membrane repeat protein